MPDSIVEGRFTAGYAVTTLTGLEPSQETPLVNPFWMAASAIGRGSRRSRVSPGSAVDALVDALRHVLDVRIDDEGRQGIIEDTEAAANDGFIAAAGDHAKPKRGEVLIESVPR